MTFITIRNTSAFDRVFVFENAVPQVGLEPTTVRLTAEFVHCAESSHPAHTCLFVAAPAFLGSRCHESRHSSPEVYAVQFSDI